MRGVDERPVPSIAGRWTVTSIREASGVAPYEVGESSWTGPVTVVFDPEPRRRRITWRRRGDGSIHGDTDCNSTDGAYRRSGTALRPIRGTMATTLVRCDGEPDLHEVLWRMRSVAAAKDDGLLLLDRHGRVLAELRRPD